MSNYIIEQEYEVRNEFGFCKYSFEKDESGEFCHIYNLYVNKQFRRKGNARQLLTNAILEITTMGHNGDILIVCNPTESSITKRKLTEFYESFGLKVYENYSGCND
jgi:ribosomal protein S18 acetylase RimI-like enzyme